MYHLDREAVYLGIEYKVISVLDNDLLLVVNKQDDSDGKFPLSTYVIPDTVVIDKRKKMGD